MDDKVINLKNLYERHERMKYKTKLYAHLIVSRVTVSEGIAESKKRELNDLEKQLGNDLHTLIDVAEHCIAVMEWYDLDRQALLAENKKLKEIVNNK